MGGDQLIESLVGAEVEAEIGDDVRTAHTVLFMELIGEVAPMPGAKALVAELLKRGHPVVLSSSASSDEVGHYIDRLDVREDVKGWTTSADVEATKPEPDLIKAALDKAGTDDAALIGDTPYDVEAAQKLGVPTIALMTGGFSEQELLDAGAVVTFKSIEELCQNFDATPLAS
ncbi:MAG: HAD family hydrolase [Actinobacteria bacterium]|nr:HAD family hydrolase [Actinomycetota bacterium]